MSWPHTLPLAYCIHNHDNDIRHPGITRSQRAITVVTAATARTAQIAGALLGQGEAHRLLGWAARMRWMPRTRSTGEAEACRPSFVDVCGSVRGDELHNKAGIITRPDARRRASCHSAAIHPLPLVEMRACPAAGQLSKRRESERAGDPRKTTALLCSAASRSCRAPGRAARQISHALRFILSFSNASAGRR